MIKPYNQVIIIIIIIIIIIMNNRKSLREVVMQKVHTRRNTVKCVRNLDIIALNIQ